MLKDLVRRYTDVFTDMPGETDVIQHQISLTDDTPIRRKLYPLPYAMREELRNEVDIGRYLWHQKTCTSFRDS